MARLDAAEVQTFLLGQTLYAFDPDRYALAATVTYARDGTCTAVFADGARDKGRFGLEGDTYWTRYERFRRGEMHRFYLISVGLDTALAYHADGRRAFLQSQRAEVDDLFLGWG